MSGQGPMAIYYALAAALVGAALVARHIAAGRAIRMALAWLAIFAFGFAVFAFRDDFGAIGQRLRAEATGTPIDDGRELRVPVADDGHFWVLAQVNGRPVRFLVDSGASVTTLGRSDARNAGVVGARTVVVNTANGPARMTQARLGALRIGPIERTNLPVFVNAADETSVLGMNFLSSLRRWSVEGSYLVLRP